MLKDRARRETIDCLGRIRLGLKKKNAQGVEHPKNVNYFVLDDAPKVAMHFGNQPSELPIYLPFPTPDENLEAFYTLWSGSNYSLCMGDGELIRSRLDLNDRTKRLVSDYQVVESYAEEDSRPYRAGQQVPCSGRTKKLYPRCQNCAPAIWLRVMVRDPNRPTQVVLDEFGYYEIYTKSAANYDRLIGRMEYLYTQAQRFGESLQGIPLILHRTEETMFYNGVDQNGQPQRRKSTQWLMGLAIDPSWIRLIQDANYRLAMSIGSNTPELPAQVEVIDYETGEIIVQPQAPAALPAPAPASTPPNGNTEPPPERPWEPEFLKDQIDKKVKNARQQMTGPITEAQVQLVAMLMSKLVDNSEEDRHSLLSYLFNVVSTKDLDKAQASVVIDWIQKDEERGVDLAAQEAAEILALEQTGTFPVWNDLQRKQFWKEVSDRELTAIQVYHGLIVTDHEDIFCGECGTYDEVIARLDVIKKKLDGQPQLV